MNNKNVLSAMVAAFTLACSTPLLAADTDSTAKTIARAEVAHIAAQMREEIEQSAHAELETAIDKPAVTIDVIDAGIASPPSAKDSAQLSSR